MGDITRSLDHEGMVPYHGTALKEVATRQFRQQNIFNLLCRKIAKCWHNRHSFGKMEQKIEIF